MENLNSRRRYILPYDSNVVLEDGTHSFQYWSLNSHFDIKSPFAFMRGDVVKVTAVGSDFVLVIPATESEDVGVGTDEPRLMVFASNDIPLDPRAVYEFEYQNCELLTRLECKDDCNKFYTMLLSMEPGSEYASVRGFCRSDRSKLTFHIGASANG